MPPIIIGILAFAFLVGINLLVLRFWLNRRLHVLSLNIQMRIRAAEEGMLVPPEPAGFRGAWAKFGRSCSSGILCASGKRIIFQRFHGPKFEIPISEISSISRRQWFLGRYRYKKQHLVLATRDKNEIAFYVADDEAWEAALSSQMEEEGRQDRHPPPASPPASPPAPYSTFHRP